MSLKIDSTLEYIQNRLGLSESQMQIYADKSIDEIIREEAMRGNQAAIELAVKMFTDPSQLIELFQLANPENKLAIIITMPTAQVEKLLPMLEKKDLIQGLRFFTMDALMDMLQKIPKEELVKTAFELFSQRQIIEMMPEKQLDKVLTGFDMDKEYLLQNMKFIPDTYLQQIIESVTGEKAEGTNAELRNQIAQLGDLAYKQAIMSLEPEQKRRLTFFIASGDNKYFQNFDAEAYTHIIQRECQKDDVVGAMGVIKREYLEKMMLELPQELLALVVTQIDTEKFADALINKFPETLARFVAG
ncbi:hypothetical protein IJ596_01890 [bacterium]|nr:hypothetical protein [bacterium]